MTVTHDASPPVASKPKPWSVAYDWWESLRARGDSATLARLRRSDPVSCLAEPGLLALYRKMGSAGYDERRLRNAARIALVLAHVRRPDRRQSFARALGPSAATADDGKLKRIRMQALLKAETEDEIIRAFRRAVDILDREANVEDLARVLATWDHEQTRMRFAFDYFNARHAAPGEGD
jgi:CRISPR type I-E-associated protein CasB/Cse2